MLITSFGLGETSYSESSAMWMGISYLLSYDISYLVPLVYKELEEKVSWFCHAGSVHSQCALFEPNLFLPAFFLSVVGCYFSILLSDSTPEINLLPSCQMRVGSVLQQNACSVCGKFIMFSTDHIAKSFSSGFFFFFFLPLLTLKGSVSMSLGCFVSSWIVKIF